MDVGAPSNFERMAAHFSWDELRRLMLGASISDEQTRKTICDIYNCGYCMDPHTAVAWHAVDMLVESKKLSANETPVVISTAHPAKFTEILEPLIGPVSIPPSLQKVMERTVNTRTIPADLDTFREILLEAI
jgi:threonine synthase